MPPHLGPFQLGRTDTFGTHPDAYLPPYHSPPSPLPGYSEDNVQHRLTEQRHREGEERSRRSINAGLQAEENTILKQRKKEAVRSMDTIIQRAQMNGDNQIILGEWKDKMMQELEENTGWNLIDEHNWKEIKKEFENIDDFVRHGAQMVNEDNEIDQPYTVEAIIGGLNLRDVVAVRKQLLDAKLRSIIQEAEQNGETGVSNLNMWANEFTHSLDTNPKDENLNYRDRFRWYKVETALSKILIAIANGEKSLLLHASGHFNPEMSPHSLILQMHLEPLPAYPVARPRSRSHNGNSLRPPAIPRHHRSHSQSSLAKFRPVARQPSTLVSRY